LADKASDIQSAGQDVGEDRGFGAVGQAEAGGAFDAAAGLVSVAAFGVTAATHAQHPGVGADGVVAGQTNVAVGKGEADAHHAAGVWAWVSGDRCVGRKRDENVRLGLVQAGLAAEPFGIAALVVVAIEGQAVAV